MPGVRGGAEEHTFTIHHRPRVKERARTGTGHAYTPKRTAEGEGWVVEAYDGPVFDGPVEVECEFYPDATTVTVRSLDEGVSPLRGDVDNYLKLILDGLQKAGAFANDKSVSSVRAVKVPRT